MEQQLVLWAEYNQLMNQRLYQVVATLPDRVIKENQGAFFESIFGTLNHIMVGDIIWLKRFATQKNSRDALLYVITLDSPTTLATQLYENFDGLYLARQKLDQVISQWVSVLSPSDLSGSITYKNMQGELSTRNYHHLISHFFMHQTHHRGQITTLLSQLDVDFGETDFLECIPQL